MKKLITLIILIYTSALADVSHSYATKDVVKKLKIIDIRTPAEWRETGIIAGSYPIMFFDDQGQYNIADFMAKLSKVAKKGEAIGVICRSGNRSIPVSDFLDKQGYKVTNLQGGIIYFIQQGNVLQKIR